MSIWSIIRDRGGLFSAVRSAARRPSAALSAMSKVLRADWRNLAFDDRSEFPRWRQELSDSHLVEELGLRLCREFEGLRDAKVRDRKVVPGGMRALHLEALWALTRARGPKLIFETGVCNGLSSAILLEALSRNGQGQLVSIDFPEFSDSGSEESLMWMGKGGAVIPAGREVGWLVREELRSSWRLEIGRSQDILVRLLREHQPIDMFIHDSEHSYENQLLEFQSGFAALAVGGILVATDISWSNGFEDFWTGIQGSGARRAFLDPSCAVVLKM